ncbi:MAG: hypothetical protein RL398_2540 [Planctomycetota bacterium]
MNLVTAMRMRWLLAPALLVLTACGSESPIAGNWSQATADGTPGMVLEFDGGSDKLIGHTAEREGGGHDHLYGTYTLDAASGMVTVKAQLDGKQGAGSWSGPLKGDSLQLAADGKTLQFQRGGKAHGH